MHQDSATHWILTSPMHYPFPTLWLGQLVALILVAFAQADYVIDDSNSTIYYIGVWNRIINPTFDEDATKLYNGTLTHSTCITSDGCHVMIPFVGTGINVYNVIRAQTNISFTVDGGSSSSYIYGWNH